MIAADGDACSTMNSGSPIHSTRGESPIHRPAVMPPIAVSPTPTSSGPRVSAYAPAKVPSPIIETNATRVSLHDGKAMLTGTRPPHSHSASTTRTDPTRSTHGWVAWRRRLLDLVGRGSSTSSVGESMATRYSSTEASAACIGFRLQKSSTFRLAGSPLS